MTLTWICPVTRGYRADGRHFVRRRLPAPVNALGELRRAAMFGKAFFNLCAANHEGRAWRGRLRHGLSQAATGGTSTKLMAHHEH